MLYLLIFIKKTIYILIYGWVAERLKAPVSKTGERVKRFGGSNPLPSALFKKNKLYLQKLLLYNYVYHGWVAEWLKAPVLKTGKR
jgi:glucose-6-phosphate dehydrogenase assembly protein OpcA